MTASAKIKWPVNVQYKNNEIVNLRPKNNLNEENFFKSEEEFLYAIQETIDMYPKSNDVFKNGKWLEKVKNISQLIIKIYFKDSKTLSATFSTTGMAILSPNKL